MDRSQVSGFRWITGVITAPRPGGTVLPATLWSLDRAGFSNIAVFSQGNLYSAGMLDYDLNGGVNPRSLTMVSSVLNTSSWGQGAYTNWRAALEKLVELADERDWILICEDDIELTVGMRDYLEAFPPDRNAVNSLYCAAPNDPFTGDDVICGWIRLGPVFLPRRSYGALCYCLSPAIATKFLENAPLTDRPHGTDHAVGLFCRDHHVPLALHAPSLVRHRDAQSSLPDAGIKECRQARRFVSSAMGWMTHPNPLWTQACFGLNVLDLQQDTAEQLFTSQTTLYRS